MRRISPRKRNANTVLVRIQQMSHKLFGATLRYNSRTYIQCAITRFRYNTLAGRGGYEKTDAQAILELYQSPAIGRS